MKTVLNIEGMSCGHCVRHVKEALAELPGVKSAVVSLKEHNAVVEHEEAVTAGEMIAAVEDAGYRASV